MDINELAKEIHEWSSAKGFYEQGKVREFDGMLANVHGEVSEALEEWRNGHDPNEIYFNSHQYLAAETCVAYGWKPEGVPTEMADIIIRVLDMCAYYEINIEKAIRLKMDYNKTRPYRNGGKRS